MAKKRTATIGARSQQRQQWSFSPHNRIVPNRKGKGAYARIKRKRHERKEDELW